jgi:VanZ family protein
MFLFRDPRLGRIARVLFWLALVFAVAMAVLPTPPKLPTDNFGDKFAHIMAFAVLAGLGTIGFGRALRWRVAERLCFLGAAIEVVQSIPGLNRQSDIRDWIADMAAVAVMTVVASWLLPRDTGSAEG